VRGFAGAGTERLEVEGQRVTFVLRIAPENMADGGSGKYGEQAEALGVNFESGHF